ncbi:MAG: pilus assembly PilX N-terminal domain-containing protein [Desulfobacterales bacterium]|nr:pilus assembly PilX N-terminal domain-containing protein [Desulfobacterales bacterium]
MDTKQIKTYGVPFWLKDESGSLILLVLVILAVMTVIGTTLVTSVSFESAVAGNTLNTIVAQYDAESGLDSTLNYISGRLKTGDTISTVYTNLVNVQRNRTTTDSLIGYDAYIEPLTPAWTGSGPHSFDVTGEGKQDAKFKIRASFRNTPLLDPAFRVGLLSEGDMRLNGNSTIVGDLHSNGDLTANSGANVITGHASAHQTANVNGTVTGGVASNAAIVSVPIVPTPPWQSDTSGVISSNATLPAFGGSWDNGHGSHNDAYILPAIVFGPNPVVIKVAGDVVIPAGAILDNVTIMATGNITFRGSSRRNNNINRNAIIALGEIEFDGSSNSYAAFWSNGLFRMNGSSTIIGSVVSRGTLTRNGAGNFSYDGSTENNNLPQTMEISLSSWRDTGLIQ